MEATIVTRNEFMQRYWKYYLILESDFLDTEHYLAIDELNFGAFSNEYIKQYQAICSEIDVIAKCYCKEMDSGFNGDKINAYCKCVTDNNPDFASRKIKLKDSHIELFPWKDWTYTTETRTNGKVKIDSNTPGWWKNYNDIKHKRTQMNTRKRLPNYKLANQENVLHSLAALFQMELYYFRKLHQSHFPMDPDMPDSPSKLFEIENWGNRWMMLGNGVAYELND